MNIIHNLNFSVHKVLLEHSYVYSFTYILSMAAFIHLQCRVESLLCGYYGWQSLKCLLCNYLQKKFAKLCPQGMTPLFFILFFLLLFCPSPIDSVFLYAYSCYSAILYASPLTLRYNFPGYPMTSSPTALYDLLPFPERYSLTIVQKTVVMKFKIIYKKFIFKIQCLVCLSSTFSFRC